MERVLGQADIGRGGGCIVSPRDALNEATRLQGEALTPGLHRSLRMLGAAVARIEFTGAAMPRGRAAQDVVVAFTWGVQAVATWHAVATGEQHETADKMADDRAWLAALHAGAATALAAVAAPGPRPGSRAHKLAELLDEYGCLTAAQLNEMLDVPLDDGVARRVVRDARRTRG